MAEIKPAWVEAAQASDKATGIPASVTLSQFIDESGWGAHCPGNNPFGIKAVHGQPMQALMTQEDIKGHIVTIPQPFRVFPTLADAFTAHAELLAHGEPYAAARAQLPNVRAFILAMAPRYATDKLYATKLLNIIQHHNLTQYDLPSRAVA